MDILGSQLCDRRASLLARLKLNILTFYITTSRQTDNFADSTIIQNKTTSVDLPVVYCTCILWLLVFCVINTTETVGVMLFPFQKPQNVTPVSKWPQGSTTRRDVNLGNSVSTNWHFNSLLADRCTNNTTNTILLCATALFKSLSPVVLISIFLFGEDVGCLR